MALPRWQACGQESGAAGSEAPESDYLVSFWRTAQGLPHNTVNAILQTRDGYLWVGTANGLARFDGFSFELSTEAGEQGLRDAVITSLVEDKQGSVWVGTQGNGLVRLRGGAAEHFGVRDGLKSETVTCLAEDRSGAVWVGTRMGLNRWDRGRLGPFESEAVPRGDAIVALNVGNNDTLWITTRSGVFRFQNGKAEAFKSDQLPQGRNAEFIGAYEDRSGNLWAFGATFLLNVTQGRSLNNFPSFNLASSRVWTICEPNNGDFWIGTSGRGLFRFQNGRFEAVGTREGLDQREIRALHADRFGNLWIGTGGNGLAQLRTRRMRIIGANEGLRSQAVSSVTPEGESGLWVGTLDTGLWRWDGRRATAWPGGGLLGSVTRIQSLAIDADKTLWAGTWGSGIVRMKSGRQQRLTTADGLGDNTITALAPASDGRCVWAGTQAGFLHRICGDQVETFPPDDRLTGNTILCLLAGPTNTLIVGSSAGGLVQWDGTELVKLTGPAELVRRPIRSLSFDGRGRLWVGTWGGGAYCRTGNTWIPVTRRQGLGSDHVALITQSPDAEEFWFGTDNNLFKCRTRELEQLLSGMRETAPFMPALASAGEGFKCAAGWPAAVTGAQGQLWLACSSEILPIGERENSGSETAPPVLLKRVLVNGREQPLPPAGVLQLGPAARSLDLEFTAICFNAAPKVRFRHKLENFDGEWVESDVARRAHYGPLPPGTYRFHVTASSPEGIWNATGATMAILVTPPVWRAWWFLTFTGLALIGGVWAAARFISTRRMEARLRSAEQQHAMERERARIAQDMHDEIGSKLTRISFLSELARQKAETQPGTSEPVQAIASTSRELLQALDEIVWAVNPRNDNLEQLAGYLEQHAREYFQATTCECQIHVPAQLPEVPLTAELRHNVFLSFEEALNNTLKHANARKVVITMRVEPAAFEVSIQDDGRGFDPTLGAGREQDGLRNIRTRLEAVGGTCTITSRPGSGTTVTLRFRLTNGAGNGMLAGKQAGSNS